MWTGGDTSPIRVLFTRMERGEGIDTAPNSTQYKEEKADSERWEEKANLARTTCPRKKLGQGQRGTPCRSIRNDNDNHILQSYTLSLRRETKPPISPLPPNPLALMKPHLAFRNSP